MIGRVNEDLEQKPMTFTEEGNRNVITIPAFSDIGLNPVRIGIKSIRFMKDRLKEFENRLWGPGYL